MQVGVSAAFGGLIPLAIYLPASLILANIAGKHQAIVYRLRGQRLDIANDSIEYNSAIKLLKAEARMEALMGDIRQQEERHTLWLSASNALTLSMQLSLATLMVCVCVSINSASAVS